MRFSRSALFISLLMASTGALVGCSKPDGAGAAQQAAPAAQVGVVTIAPTAANLSVELPGRITAFQTAEIRPQVSGIVRKREFTEGAAVKQGDSLYQIDPATYEATLAAAKASLARADANLQTSQAKAGRVAELVKDNLVSKQDFDDTQAAFKQAQADVLAARAQVKTAQINLDYTRVTAPIAGRISKSEVTAGALVTANQATALATISQLDPIYVDITQSSAQLLQLKQSLADGSLTRTDATTQVQLILENGTAYAHPGSLQFSEVTVDQATGSVTLRALFPNPDGVLLPGMYARAQLNEGVREAALLVPQRAVTRNARGEATALVVNADNQVEARVLSTNRTLGDQWLVDAGLVSGDRVIVEGVQRVRPGATVNAQPYQAAPSSTNQPQ